MESWAQAIPEVQFLCVCVESLGVAQTFDRLFGFRHAINCYIPSSAYMPRGYGQLGCSGFIVSDSEGNFVSRKTRAYLQYGEIAFRHVETILAQLLDKQVSSESKKRMRDGAAKNKENHSKVDGFLPSSVGVGSMDQEHESCAKALKALEEAPSEENLRKVLKELEDHFAHEEMLMIQHGFGGGEGAGNPFSALNSHIEDHVRILDMVNTELKKCNAGSVCLEATS